MAVSTAAALNSLLKCGSFEAYRSLPRFEGGALVPFGGAATKYERRVWVSKQTEQAFSCWSVAMSSKSIVLVQRDAKWRTERGFSLGL